MNVITLSKRQFEKLELLNLPKEIIHTEGNIFQITYHRNTKILKNLFLQSGYMFANKLYTLEMLDMNKDIMPHYFAIPNDLVAVNHQIVGFTVPYVAGVNLACVLQSKDYSLEEQLFYLKKVGEILHEMKMIRTYTSLNDFYLNDLHEANFIVDVESKNIHVIDLDSSKIGDNLVFPSRYLMPGSLLEYAKDKYRVVKNNACSGYVEADENSDLYCYMMMILNFLRGSNMNRVSLEEFYRFLNFLDMIHLNKELLDIFHGILIHRQNENPYSLLDSIGYKELYMVRTKKLI